MKVTAERVPDSQVVLEIEVEPERVEKSMDRAFKKMAPRYRIPGFRPGKAPRVMFERFVGRDTLMREALENLVPEVYEEAIKEESLEPIGQPQFEFPTLEPLTIKATVPLKPTVTIGEYRALRVEREPAEVTDEEVDQSLAELQRRYATLEPVERPVQAGDVIRANLRVTADDRELYNQDDVDLRLVEDGMKGLPGLLEQLVGTEKGKEYDFDATVPEDYDESELAGKSVHYHVTISEVKEERLPELNDAFASEVGEGFADIAALRQRLEDDLRKRKEEETERDYDRKIVDALVEQATIEYPPMMVDAELDALINEQFGGNNRNVLQSVLQRSGRTMDDFREQFRDTAVERLKRSLVLSQVAEEEGLSVDHPEIDAEIERITAPLAAQNPDLRNMFADAAGHGVIERSLLTRKVNERLRDIAAGKEVPPPAPRAPAGEAEAATSDGAPASQTEPESTEAEASAEGESREAGEPSGR